MKNLKDLSINPENVLNKEELVKLRGGTEGEGRCGGGNNGTWCAINIGDGVIMSGWVCVDTDRIREFYPGASYGCA